jgi:hypothetical protein
VADDYPDFEGGKSKLFTVADWAALEATDKTFTLAADGYGFGDSAYVLYTPDAGKTFYVTDFSILVVASEAADGDKPQMCAGQIYDATDDKVLWRQGGNGGIGQSFNIPIAVDGGHEVRFYALVYANHSCQIGISAKGYEI